MTEQNRKAFQEKFLAFLRTHKRIVEDFTRSLGSARQFLELAQVSMDKEPEETITMLEQIREIDLLGHLGRQFEEFQQVSGLLTAARPPEELAQMMEELGSTQSGYQELLSEAESQVALLEKLFLALTSPN